MTLKGKLHYTQTAADLGRYFLLKWV